MTAKNPPKITLTADGRRLGISKIAKALGVHRNHLRYVLIGERQSASLMRKVEEQYPFLLHEFSYKK